MKPSTIRQAKQQRAVQDPSMVIEDRGTKLEVLPTLRAIQVDAAPERKIVRSAASAALSPSAGFGIIRNHTRGVDAVYTGEIAFQAKQTLDLEHGTEWSELPGIRKLTQTNVYLVTATSPQEFVRLTKLIATKPEVDWVQPVVLYNVPLTNESIR